MRQRHPATRPAAWLLLTCLLPAGLAAATERIEILLAVEGDGTASPLWGELLRRRRLSEPAIAEALQRRHPLAPEEAAWETRIRERAAVWPARVADLVPLFSPVTPPPTVRVLLGNRAGEDGMTHDGVTVAFDLAKLASLYGDAGSEENRERIDRLFAHEYAHLLQKAWLPDHPQPESTPFDLALLEIWSEGLGNRISLSSRWRAAAGEPSPAARGALARLEPRFVERLMALACASPAEAERLTADLSNGPFTEKWGALTAALWLEQEASADPQALRRFVQAGAAGVRELARRHLAAADFAALERARERSLACE